MKVICIGPLPPPVGGTTVLFSQLVSALGQFSHIQVQVISTSRYKVGYFSRSLQAAKVCLSIVRRIRRVDVVTFHASITGAVFFSPIIWCLCRIFQKKFLFRGFGGGYDKWYESATSLRRFLFRKFALSADLVLLETRISVDFFARRTSTPVTWYPNSRPIAPVQRREARSDSASLRFVFVGHVKNSKGIQELVDAAASLGKGFQVEIYGPLMDGWTAERLNSQTVQYRGELKADAVVATLQQYDALVLPTYYDGEGYPGVILESYSAGIPVVSTQWRAIPEIVNESCGVLVAPRNSVELADAMSRFQDPIYLESLQAGARAMSAQFSADFWSEEFVRICKSLLSR